MYVRPVLFLAAVAMAVPCVGASGASAATLFTSAAHTAEVPVGATATATATAFRITSGTATFIVCNHSLLHFQLVRNSGGVVASTVVAGSFSSCINAMTFTGPWTMEVAGSATMVGATNAWGAALTNFRADFLGGLWHGNLTTGVSMTGTTASGTNLCLDANKATVLTHPLVSGGASLDAQYCLIGTAASWALT